MQYALLDGFERKFLLDALEFGVLKDWKENPVKELPDIDESAHPFHVCYGGYLLNPRCFRFRYYQKNKRPDRILAGSY